MDFWHRQHADWSPKQRTANFHTSAENAAEPVMPVDERRAKTPTRVSSAVLSVVRPSTRPATSLQSSKTMINPKLLVLVAAVAYFTYPTVNFYRKGGIDVTETVDPDGLLTRDFKFEFSPEALDGLPADDISKLPALTQKVMCSLKLFRGWHAYQAMDSFTESDFYQLCKTFTEIDKCYANADSGSDPWSIVIDSMHGRPYECNKPIFKTALRLCKLTYEDAVEVRNCYHNGMMQFSGSADEFACRRRCCHDHSTFDASKPMICGPEKDILTSEYCQDPFLDYTLRDNACQTYCAVDALNHYALNHCSDDALSVFMTYGKETMIKYMSSEKCFETCSW